MFGHSLKMNKTETSRSDRLGVTKKKKAHISTSVHLLVLLCEYQGQYNSRTKAALQMGKIVIQGNLTISFFGKTKK